MSAIDRAEFYKKGYAVVRSLFPPDEAEQIRAAVVKEVTRLDQLGQAVADVGSAGRALHPPGDMLSFEPLRRVLLDPRLIGAVGELLGGSPAYWGESAVTVGAFGGARAWHTDAYDTPVSRGRVYPLVRCGLYLQNIADYSGGLAIRPRSHAFPLTKYRPALVPFPISLVDSRPGDLVIWDMRLAHAGEAVRMRYLRKVGLPLSLQGRLPDRLRLPEERQRVVMFPTFGLPGPDLDSWLAYLRTRDYMRDTWRNSRFPAEVWLQAEAAGLKLVRAVPEWGGSEMPADVEASADIEAPRV